MSLSAIWGRSWTERLSFSVSLVFLVIANVPGTIALRYMLLVLSLMLLLCRLGVFREAVREQRGPVLALLLFVAYAALHCAFLTRWPAVAWGELASQVVVGVLWFFVGLGLFRRRDGMSILDLAILAGAILALAEFLHGAWVWHVSGEWPYMTSFTTVTKLEFTFFMNLVLGFVVPVLCFGHRSRVRPSWLPYPALLLITALIVFVSLRAGARNGMIGMAYLSLSMMTLFVIFERKRIGTGRVLMLAAAVLLVMAGLVTYAVHKDTRNQEFVESAKAGWHYDRTAAWLRQAPVPLMPNGVPVDASAFERIAWIHSGLDLIAAHPLGYGYGRGAFGRAIAQQGHPNHLAHSHSGFIDLGVGLGLPGVALWLLFCFALIGKGVRAFVDRNEILGLVLMLVCCGFVGRMLMESVMRDHMLYLFLFVSAGLLSEMEQRRTQRM